MNLDEVHHKRLTAALRRRDDGTSRPFLWDNAVLAVANEPGNPRPPILPDPALLSDSDRRLIERLSNNPMSARELADALGSDETAIRSTINRLRDPAGWWIENDRRGRFMLVPLPPLRLAA